MSELKVDKISPRSGTAFTFGDLGDTFTIPVGATITNSGTATGFGGGKILQLAHTTATFGITTASASANTFVDSTVTITLTPTSATSKFIVYFGIGSLIENEPDDGGYGYRVKKVQSSASTYPAFLSDWNTTGNAHSRRYFYDNQLSNINSWSAYDTFTGVDADNHTTASLTYTVQFAGLNVGTALKVGNVYGARSQIIVQEVAN
jgi:hypothetical protein